MRSRLKIEVCLLEREVVCPSLFNSFHSDGASDDDYKLPAAAIRGAGIDIFAVGVGNSKLSELQEITGKNERAFRTRRFKEIAQFNQKLVGEICDATEAACPDQEVDLIFMLDSSGSIGKHNFEIAREWLISITKSFQIGPLATQVAVIQYTNNPTPEFDLDDYGTVSEVENGLKRMRLANGATRTDKARVLNFLTDFIIKTDKSKIISHRD